MYKKISLFVVPLLATVFLVNCGESKPEPVVYHTITFKGTDCYMIDDIGGQVSEKQFEVGQTASYHLVGKDSGYEIPKENNVDITITETGEKFDGIFSYNDKDGSLSVKMTANVTVTARSEKKVPWYDKTEWWNYCSEATANDIGKKVPVTLTVEGTGVKHEVRLIDIDHDDLANEKGKAHCTFEFVNLVSDENGDALKPNWADESELEDFNKHAFPNSKLDKFLNDNNDSVLKMLPAGLESAIKLVDKNCCAFKGAFNAYTAEPSQFKLFPLALREITDIECAEDSQVCENEGNKYSYYNNLTEPEDYFKFDLNNTDYVQCWLRSPDVKLPASIEWKGAFTIYDKASYEEEIEDSGKSDLFPATTLEVDYCGVAPAFCI